MARILMSNSIIQKINIKYIHYHNQQFLKYIWLQILNNTHFKVFIMLSYIYKYAYGFVYLLKKNSSLGSANLKRERPSIQAMSYINMLLPENSVATRLIWFMDKKSFQLLRRKFIHFKNHDIFSVSQNSSSIQLSYITEFNKFGDKLKKSSWLRAVTNSCSLT